jgi:hypothetical protein
MDSHSLEVLDHTGLYSSVMGLFKPMWEIGALTLMVMEASLERLRSIYKVDSPAWYLVLTGRPDAEWM